MSAEPRIVTLPLLRHEAQFIWRVVSDLAASEPPSRTAQNILEMLARPLGKPSALGTAGDEPQ